MLGGGRADRPTPPPRRCRSEVIAITRSAASLILALTLVATACGDSTEPDTDQGTTTTAVAPTTATSATTVPPPPTTTTASLPAPTATTTAPSPPPTTTTTLPPPPPTTTTTLPPPPPTTTTTVPPAGTVHNVSLHDNGGFSIIPSKITISVGDTVRWTNTGGSAHTSTSGSGGTFPGSPDGIWESPDLGPGDVYSRTFTSVGTFTYFCRFHPILMRTAVVEVQP